MDAGLAIYDIAARTVYLPNGRRLEAHSGFGSHMDDARYVNLKRQGPTPPRQSTGIALIWSSCFPPASHQPRYFDRNG